MTGISILQWLYKYKANEKFIVLLVEISCMNINILLMEVENLEKSIFYMPKAIFF